MPDWNFVEWYEKNGVQYVHGEGGTARTKCRADMMNTVQGHLHTQAYCEHYVGQNFRVFGMQVGCGIDHESYAMAYAKYGKKPAIGCGVVLNNGKLPINLLMELWAKKRIYIEKNFNSVLIIPMTKTTKRFMISKA